MSKAQNLLVCALIAVLSCGESPSRNACIPGLQLTCPCLHGQSGVQRCLPNGTFSECTCDPEDEGTARRSLKIEDAGYEADGGEQGSADAGDAGMRDMQLGSSGGTGGSRGVSAGAGAGGTHGASGSQARAPTGTEVVMMLTSGSGRLIDAFAASSGIVVVLSTGVRLLARDGTELAHWDDSRMIGVAAIDGDIVGVADGAILTALDANDGLHEVSSTPLTEACEAAVIVSQHRFVCGNGNDTGRAFRTYDLTTGQMLGSGGGYIYKGIPMRRVTGLDQFVTVSTTTSPADFSLFIVGADGVVQYLGESPYHGDIGVSPLYAFDGDPAKHLITHEGILLDLSRPECTAMPTSNGNAFQSNCFYKDGALGTLLDGQRYVALHDHGGSLYALVDRGQMPAPGSTTFAYYLQNIDVAARSVRAQVGYKLDNMAIRGFSYDPVSSRVVLSGNVFTSVGGSSDNFKITHQVLLLSL